MAVAEWVEYVSAFGTAGAALFAGWAAWVGQGASRSANLSAQASLDLMTLEKTRDARMLEEKAQVAARSIVLSMAHRSVDKQGQHLGRDFCLTIRNAGLVAVFDTMLQVTVGGNTWGPQKVGAVAPGAAVEAYAFVPCSDPNARPRAISLFVDGAGRSWVAAPGGDLTEVGIHTRLDWAVRAEEFAQASMPRDRRGVLRGLVDLADFDAWRKSVEDKGS